MSTTPAAPALPARGRLAVGPAVARVLAVVAFARAAQFVEVLLFPLVAATRGVGTAGAAAVLLSLALGTTGGSLLGGALVDRVGAKLVAAAGLALASAAAFALTVGDSALALGAAAALYGAAGASWRLALETATAQALASDPSDEGAQATRERAFGAFIWLVNIGALLSALAVAGGIDPRAGIALQAVLMGTAAATAAALLQATKDTSVSAPVASGSMRPFLLFAIAYAPLTMVMFQAFAGMAALFDDHEYRTFVLVNAVTLVVFPLALWRAITRIDGMRALLIGAALQGGGLALAAALDDPVLATILFSSGEAMLLGIVPAIVAGVAPHATTGRYRSAFSTVQGVAAAAATFAGPLLAETSAELFVLAVVAATGLGLGALASQRRVIDLGLRQPVACPCGALSCTCSADHLSCAFPSPIMARPAVRASV